MCDVVSVCSFPKACHVNLEPLACFAIVKMDNYKSVYLLALELYKLLIR